MSATTIEVPFEQFLIMPFRKGKGGKLVPAERRPGMTEAGTIRTAEAMAPRFAGVLAIAAMVDPDNGDLHEPRELARFGDVPDLDVPF